MSRIALLSVFVIYIVGGQALTEEDVDHCLLFTCGSVRMTTKYCGLVNSRRRTLSEESLDCLSECDIPYKLAYPGVCAEDKWRITHPRYSAPCHLCTEDLDFDQLCPNIRTPNFKVISRNNVECKNVCSSIDVYKFVKIICENRRLSPYM